MDKYKLQMAVKFKRDVNLSEVSQASANHILT